MSTSKPARRTTGKAKTPVRVWSECGVTIQVDEYNYIRFSFGHERISPSDSIEDLENTERKVYEFSERIVDKRTKKLARLAASVRASEPDGGNYG